MIRRFLLFLVIVGVSACVNDYDQFDLAPQRTGNGEASRPDTRKPDAATGQDGSSSDAVSPTSDAVGLESGDAGVIDVGSGDVADATDVGADTTKPPADASADVDAAVDAEADAADAGSDAETDGALEDASPDAAIEDGGEVDVSIEPDASGDGSPPDVSVGEDGSAGEDVSVDGDGGAANDAAMDVGPDCDPDHKRCGDRCVALDDPATGCGGASCSACDLPHATARCGAERQCAVGACAAGFDDCDRVPGNGCETSLTTDVGHCGGCGRACSGEHTLARECAGGLCVSACEKGYANCDRPPTGADNGCERAVAGEPANCGSCGNDCRAQGSGLVCGVVPNQCGCAENAGCRANGSTGTCEKATGLCKCSSSLCRAGETCNAAQGPDVCSCNGASACSEGETCCQTPNGCFNLLSDASNCGVCGRICPRGLFCIQGECGCSADSHCNAGSAGTCTNGQCACGGTTCAPGRRCLAGGSCE